MQDLKKIKPSGTRGTKIQDRKVCGIRDQRRWQKGDLGSQPQDQGSQAMESAKAALVLKDQGVPFYTHSCVTHRYLKDRTTKKRGKKETVLQSNKNGSVMKNIIINIIIIICRYDPVTWDPFKTALLQTLKTRYPSENVI